MPNDDLDLLLDMPLSEEEMGRALVLGVEHRAGRITDEQYRSLTGTSQEARAAALQMQFIFALGLEATEEETVRAVELLHSIKTNRQRRPA